MALHSGRVQVRGPGGFIDWQTPWEGVGLANLSSIPLQF